MVVQWKDRPTILIVGDVDVDVVYCQHMEMPYPSEASLSKKTLDRRDPGWHQSLDRNSLLLL